MTNFTGFIKGGLLLTAASIIVRLSGIIVLVPLARLLGSEQLGIYSLIFWIVQSSSAIGRLGVDVAIHRNGAQLYKTDPAAAGRLLGVGSALMTCSFATISTALWIWKEPLAEHWFVDQNAARWMSYASILVLLEGLNIVLMVGLLGIHEFKGHSFSTSAGAVGRLIFSPVLTSLYGLSGAFLGLIIASSLQLSVSLVCFRLGLQRNAIHLTCQGIREETQKIIKFGFPFYMGSALSAILTIPIMGEIGRIAGVETLGYVRIGQSVNQIISFIPAAIQPVTISILSEAYVNPEQEFHELQSVHLRFNWFTTLTITIILNTCSYLLVILLFGEKFQIAVPIVIGMNWIAFMTVLSENFNLYSLSAGKTKEIAIGSIAQKIILTILSLLLVPISGAAGFIWAYLTGLTIQIIIMLIALWKAFENKLKMYICLLTILTFINMIIIYYLNSLKLLVYLQLLIGIFLILIFSLLGFKYVISLEEKQKISFWFQKLITST